MKYRAGGKYQLAEDYEVMTPIQPVGTVRHGYITLQNSGLIQIEAGYMWDGPSGPTVDTPDFMRGSLVHDAFYELMREGKLSIKHRKAADKLLRFMCIEDGMEKLRAAWVYQAVHEFGEASAMRQKEVIYEVP